ncbi:hypothetical protein LSH36_48g03055 [Paralvinella palmiformis]|uniref:HEAT repeat-containing protein 6 n=1 Tax=Paralvinella palmiformis TaxID=53620 RepID=A0AAD9K6C2_9ANNE|nr:hypothetical protein LSH36_48g03055 [Paralvinella palmiformis]
MKDPSPKARTGALTVLTALVDGSKQYLMAAEESDQYRNAPFTPFSVNLGHMIKEIHRSLLLALVSETSPLATTQIIKCLATMIPNVPYQRLRPGLLTRVLKQIYPFISHRDPNIRVACLTCLGSMATVQTPLMEVVHLFQMPPSVKSSNFSAMRQRLSETSESSSSRKNSDSGYQSVNTRESMDGVSHGSSPQVLTPQLSGTQSPLASDVRPASLGDSSPSWVIKLCVGNVTPHLLDRVSTDDNESAIPRVLPPGDGQGQVQPLPVRLESLQNLAVMARNYFFLLRPCLFMMRDVGFCCLEDPDPVVKLHGTKLLEELGAVILQQNNDNVEDGPSLQVMTDFWMPLLNGPLPRALQTVDYIAVKSTVCDCLATIGSQVFEKMPFDKRILCITLMLGLCDDGDHHVRSTAVRALGVYVLYPCLREDVSFVADVANCIIKALQEQILGVRVKSAWSLGNLSDALVLNRTDNDEAFIEDFSDAQLLKLFEASIQASRDNDKVKSNAVRAIGNLLRYLPNKCLENSKFQPVTETAIQALVKNISTGNMKVRWNACYATGNMFKNPLLPVGDSSWTESIFEALCSVIRSCKNFKVRINAALTFSVLTNRHNYGGTSQYCTIWQSLVISLESAEAITDFTEYRYRDNLTEQVCSSMVHMFTLLQASDLKLFYDTMQSHYQCLCLYMEKYKQLLCEKENNSKVSEMVKAQENAKQLAKSDMDQQLSTYLSEYIALFSIERPEPPEYDESQMTSVKPPKSGFIQTYD